MEIINYEKGAFESSVGEKGISKSRYRSIAKKAMKRIDQLEGISKSANTEHAYDFDEGFINLAAEKRFRLECRKLAKKYKSIANVVVCGIGGSNLGTIAVHEAVNGVKYNEKSKKRIHFADTVDAEYVSDIADIVSDKPFLLIAISKSGTTMETIANFSVFLDILRKNFPDRYKNYVVLITGRHSKLWEFGKEFNRLEIPKKVGGRYSVMSNVGLFPLAVVGVDISRFLEGADDMLKKCLKKEIYENPAMMNAAIQYYMYKKKGMMINDTFVFSKNLKSLGGWERQLMGETIGRSKDIKGKKVVVGITPTVNIGTVDLHSQVQNNLGGPNIRYTNFIKVLESRRKRKVPSIAGIGKVVEDIKGKDFDYLMKAVLNATVRAYKKVKRPSTMIAMKKISERAVGEWMMLKFMEKMLLAHLLNINPFGQDEVELYKSEAREIIKKGRKVGINPY